MSDKTMDTDVLIIGSGPIGATYARFLAGEKGKVTMIDAGPQLSARPGSHLLNSVQYQHQPSLSRALMLANRGVYSIPGEKNFQNPDQDSDLNMPNAAAMQAVGGMFGLWSAFAPDPAEIERTGLILADEWDSLLAVARMLFQTRTDTFEPSAVNRAITHILTQAGHHIENVPMAARKRHTDGPNPNPLAHMVTWTGTDTILGPLADVPSSSQNFEILPEHRAEKLQVKGDTIVSAEVRDLATHELKEIHAHTFIVTAGSFYTPRLLWASEIRPPALGRYLHEHSIAKCKLLLNDDVLQALRDDPENPARHEAVPIAWNDPSPKSGFAPTKQKPWIGHMHRPGRSTLYEDWLKHDVRLSLNLKWFGMIDPVPSNRVIFHEDAPPDRFGMPRITIEYQFGAEDQQRADDMLEDLKVFADLLGGQFIEGEKPKLHSPGSTVHLMGTFRMGDHPDTSVVDTNSRVRDYNNLYLGGLGVINTKMASNPSLTACALAVRSVASILKTPPQQLLTKLEQETL